MCSTAHKAQSSASVEVRGRDLLHVWASFARPDTLAHGSLRISHFRGRERIVNDATRHIKSAAAHPSVAADLFIGIFIEKCHNVLMTKSEQMHIIHEEIEVLKESPLYDYRTQNKLFPVIGEGSYDAAIMFVGEAPGRNEAKTGKPFCGAAGKVLNKLLEHINTPRESVYITNIVKDRPPENRDPTKEEIQIYGPFLDRQIEIIKPKIIVALGRYSMGYIMEKFGLHSHLAPIGQLHGKSFEAKTNYGSINVVIQYHPCMGVYNPNNIPNLKKDMEILKKITKQYE